MSSEAEGTTRARRAREACSCASPICLIRASKSRSQEALRYTSQVTHQRRPCSTRHRSHIKGGIAVHVTHNASHITGRPPKGHARQRIVRGIQRAGSCKENALKIFFYFKRQSQALPTEPTFLPHALTHHSTTHSLPAQHSTPPPPHSPAHCLPAQKHEERKHPRSSSHSSID